MGPKYNYFPQQLTFKLFNGKKGTTKEYPAKAEYISNDQHDHEDNAR